MELTLNGRPISVEVGPDDSLLDLLRGPLGLRSMKDGCAPEGSCGACTVIVDGRAVVSCAQPAGRFAGHVVETLEGLAPEVRTPGRMPSPSTGASQCGYCSPGIVMKAEALLRREPDPTRDGDRPGAGRQPLPVHRLPQDRRGGPGRRRDPTRREGRATGPPGRPGAAIPDGARAERYEARELALGDKPFVADLQAPGMLHGALRFADHPRAIVRRIDVARALAEPDVVAVADRGGRPRPASAGPDRGRLAASSWRRARRPAMSATSSPPSPPRPGPPPAAPRRSSRSTTRSWSRSPTRSTPSPTAPRDPSRTATSCPVP